MQLTCLHLYSPDIATSYIQSLRGESTPEWSWWQPDLATLMTDEVNEAEASRLTGGLALAMADRYPTFHAEGCGLTQWEAMIDRGIGMLMRPPARIFVDHGHNPYLIDKMPIRLDMQGGFPMGGAWIPPHLVPKLHEMIEQRLDLWAKRIQEAEMDPYQMLGTLYLATEAALKEGLGLMESSDILSPGTPVIQAPERKKMDPEFRSRIQAALTEEKKTLMDRLFRRGDS